MEKLRQAFDDLVGTLLIVRLCTLYRVQQSLTLLSNTIESIMDAMMLPGVLNKQDVK